MIIVATDDQLNVLRQYNLRSSFDRDQFNVDISERNDVHFMDLLDYTKAVFARSSGLSEQKEYTEEILRRRESFQVIEGDKE